MVAVNAVKDEDLADSPTSVLEEEVKISISCLSRFYLFTS